MKKVLGLLVLASIMTFANELDVKTKVGVGYLSNEENHVRVLTPNVDVKVLKSVDLDVVTLKGGLGLNSMYRSFSSTGYKVGDNNGEITEANIEAKNKELESMISPLNGATLIPYLTVEAETKISNFNIYSGANVGYGVYFNEYGTSTQKLINNLNEQLEKSTTTEEKESLKTNIENAKNDLEKKNPSVVYKGYVGGKYSNYLLELGYGNVEGLSLNLGYEFFF